MPGLKLMAELGLDGSSFAAGFHRAKGLAEGVAEGIKHVVVGAIGVLTVEEAISRTVETAKELVETSERLAIAPEQLQVLQQAAKNANIDFEKLVETMEKLSIAREKALMPGAEGFDARRAFRAMGVSNEQLHGMTSSQLLLGPIRNAVLGRNPEELGVIFRELGVKAFGGLIPLLKTNFEELEKKLRDFGGILDTETLVKLKSLSEEFSLLSKIIVSQVGPAMVKFAEVAYRALLKLGGKVAEGGSFLGAMVGSQGVGGTLTSFVSSMGHSISHALGFISDKEFDKKMREVIPKTAVENMPEDPAAVFHALEKQLDGFLAELKRRAEELDNPKPEDLDRSSIPPKLPRKALVEQSDSLVKIGNFLGGNDRIINRLQEKQVYWLEKIHGRLKVNSGYGSTMQFPVQGAVSNIVNPNIMMGPNMPQN